MTLRAWPLSPWGPRSDCTDMEVPELPAVRTAPITTFDWGTRRKRNIFVRSKWLSPHLPPSSGGAGSLTDHFVSLPIYYPDRTFLSVRSALAQYVDLLFTFFPTLMITFRSTDVASVCSPALRSVSRCSRFRSSSGIQFRFGRAWRRSGISSASSASPGPCECAAFSALDSSRCV